MVNAPKYSIIIPTLNLFEYTSACIMSVRKYSSNYEIVIIDNGSTPEIQQMYKIWEGPDVIIRVFPKALGYARACNIGAHLAKGEYLVFLNNDTLVCPNWLGIMDECCKQFGDAVVGAAGQKLAFEEDTVRAYNWVDWKMTNRLPCEVDYVGGGVTMMSRRVFNTVGDYDENMGAAYCEDTDYGVRCKDAGYKSVVVSLPGYIHHANTTINKVLKEKSQVAIQRNFRYMAYKQTLKNCKKQWFSNVDEVSCMVLSWNTLSDTKLCVHSIMRERNLLKVCGVKMNLIVIDNGSTDGTQEWLRSVRGIDELILNKENLGISVGRNSGIDKRSGKYLFMVDSDITIIIGSFVAMLKYMQGHPEIANIGAYSWQVTQNYAEQTHFLRDITKVVEGWESAKAAVSGLPTAMTQYGIFRSEIFDTCRFDTEGEFGKPGWGYEDNDLAMQMKAKGFRMQRFDDIIYYHPIGSAPRNFKAQGQSDMHKERMAYVKAKWGLNAPAKQ